MEQEEQLRGCQGTWHQITPHGLVTKGKRCDSWATTNTWTDGQTDRWTDRQDRIEDPEINPRYLHHLSFDKRARADCSQGETEVT